MKLTLPIMVIAILLVAVLGFALFSFEDLKSVSQEVTEKYEENNLGGLVSGIHPLSIESLRNGEYPGSEFVIEQTLDKGSDYQRYIVSYKSEGLKIYTLLTVPNGNPPDGGFPAIIFNHGYIRPSEYRTTEKYIAYTDGFSKNGYVLLRPDYRGHGNSEGTARGGYGSNDYSIDILNALSSLKKYPDVNPEKIGMWGHSMGGHITLRNMVVTKDIKAGVIWAGVVASYEDLFYNWRRRNVTPMPSEVSRRGGGWRQELNNIYGDPTVNIEFWKSLSSNSYLSDISGPIQLHHGTEDTSVPYEFSRKLETQLKEAGKEVELYLYSGDDHNISSNFNQAMSRSVKFFDKYLKQAATL